jgi:UDP-N-acetylglucosamine 2-epimerase (non-hydrolysing)
MSPVIKVLEKRQVDFFILHTGQHYSYELDKMFFEQLNLPKAKYNLEVGSNSHGKQTAAILVGIERILEEEKPDVILVQGDTNSVLAGALAAAKLRIKIGHIEAGLRSYDRNMPEETNRVLTDHCSDYLFAPTQRAKQILQGEGISEDSIFITGNTIVDAINQNLEIAEQRSHVLSALGVKSGRYILATVHRQENVDDKARFTSILKALNEVNESLDLPVLFPVHPHSRARINEFGLDAGKIGLINPVDYLGFIELEKNARLILTDSGGVQEEACILGVPCVTLRDNTERPETVEVGANILAGTSANEILRCVREMSGRAGKWEVPFGDGKAAENIVGIILEKV